MDIQKNRKKIVESSEKLILEIIKNRNIEMVQELVRIMEKEYNISLENSIKTLNQLQSEGKIKLQNPEPKSQESSEIRFIRFLGHSINRDYWFILLSAILGLFFSFIIESESIFAIIRAVFGTIAFFFSIGYLIIDIVFFKENIEIYEKIGLSIGLSTVISPIILYSINFTPLKLTEIYNVFQFSIIIILGFLFSFIRYKKMDLSKLEVKKPLITRKRLLLLTTLCLILAALVRSWNIYQFPLFGTPSDPWLHYGITKAAINLKWFEFYYGAIYDVFYPLFYMTLVGLKFLSGFNLLLILKSVPMILGIFTTFFLMILAYRVTKKWGIAILTGLFCSTIDVITPINSATLWPNTIGYMFFPLIIFAFLRVSEEKKFKNMALAFIFFSYLTVTHVVSIAAVIAALILIAMTLFFRKSYNKEFFQTLIVCVIFFIIWAYIFYLNKLSELISINFSQLEFSSVLLYGTAGLLGICLIYFYLKQFGPKALTDFKLEISKTTLLIIALIFGIGLNPILWWFFPITSGFAQGTPIFNYIILFIAVYPMLIIGIFGFKVIITRGGMRDQYLTGCIVGLLILAVLVMFGGKYLFSGRIGSFGICLMCIFSAIAIFSIFSAMKNRTRKKIILLSLITIYSSPLTLMYRYPLIYGIEETRYSEFQCLSWLSPHVPSFPIFIGDNRVLYLLEGVVWHPIMSLQFIGDIPVGPPQLTFLAFITGQLSTILRLGLYPIFFPFLKKFIKPFTDIGFGPVYIPIFRYFFDVGPIDLATGDETIPTIPLTIYDLILFSNSVNYNKIFDNWFSQIYMPNF